MVRVGGEVEGGWREEGRGGGEGWREEGRSGGSWREEGRGGKEEWIMIEVGGIWRCVYVSDSQ